MVFALGSIVPNKFDDPKHINYYNQSKDQLPLDSFGSGHLETSQVGRLLFALHQSAKHGECDMRSCPKDGLCDGPAQRKHARSKWRQINWLMRLGAGPGGLHSVLILGHR